GDPGQAAEGFQQIVQNNGEFLGLANGESGGNTRPRLLAAAKFWLARTLRDLGRTEEYEASLHGLVQSNPLSFYGLAARGELQIPFTTLFDKDGNEPEVNRFPGLGEAEKKALARAERLVSVGLHRFARLELERVQSLSDAPGFWFYLSKLWTRSAGHLQAIGLSWKVLAAKDGDKMSPVLAELLFPRPFREKINLHSEKQGLDPLLVLALMRQESAFAPRATSSAQAVGLMQLLPSTAELVASTLGREPPDEERLMEPDENIALGTAYLKGLFDTFQGRAAYALAAYNAGPAKVKQWVELRGDFTPLEFIETIPFNETRDYVKKVLRNYWIYQILTERRAISSIEEFLNFPNPGGPAGQAHSIP
ncbi:MAG: lytic transglycosylase domain-containing protein, partial [Nitrospinaceae bacterium]